MPTPEVTAKARRRSFSARFKLEVLAEADACREPGEVGALLRRHGLYSSHLSVWRREREAGALARMNGKRGPKPTRPDPLARRIAELERENARLQARLRKAEVIIEVQKKVSELLGIPLKSPESDGDA